MPDSASPQTFPSGRTMVGTHGLRSSGSEVPVQYCCFLPLCFHHPFFPRSAWLLPALAYSSLCIQQESPAFSCYSSDKKLLPLLQVRTLSFLPWVYKDDCFMTRCVCTVSTNGFYVKRFTNETVKASSLRKWYFCKVSLSFPVTFARAAQNCRSLCVRT